MAKAQSSATRLVVAVNTNCGSVDLLLQNDKTIARYSIGKKKDKAVALSVSEGIRYYNLV